VAETGKRDHGFSTAFTFGIGAAAVMALLAIAGLPRWQVWALMSVGVVSFTSAALLVANDRGWLRVSAVDRFPRLIVLLSISWVVPIYVALLVMPLPQIQPFYQESAFLTEGRRNQITLDINDFYEYLAKVGFKIPSKTPTIGTRAGADPSGGGIYPGADVQTAIFIPEDRIDDPAIVEWQYGNVLFAEPFRADDLSQSHYINLLASMLFSSYYVSSFNNRNISPPGYKWGNALWTMRTRYGQRTMDSMMLALFQTWSPNEYGPVDPTRPDFDGVFARNLSYASSLLGKPPGEIESILQAEGIKTKKSQ
jgi:hypothetical protein